MNTRDIIVSLGGPSVLGPRLGIRPQAVSNWQSEGIPYKHWPALQAAGITLDALQATRHPDAPASAEKVAAEAGA